MAALTPRPHLRLAAALLLVLPLLPYCDAAPPVPPEALKVHAQLIRDGYVRVPSVLARGEALALGARVATAAAAEAAQCALCSAAEAGDVTSSSCFGCAAAPGASSFARAWRLAELDPVLASLVTSARLASYAALAMDVPAVRLYQATAFLKHPGDAPSAWHQDAAACPLHTDKLVTLWVALDDVPVAAGPLRFVRGSHLPDVAGPPSLRGLSPLARLGAMARWTDADMRAMTGLTITAPRAMSAGDATLHLGWTLHGAPPNTSNATRPALAVTYFADGARVHPDLLELEGEGAAPPTAAGALRGMRLDAEGGGQALYVRLLSDDARTWLPWLRARPPVLIPGAPVRHPTLTPLVFSLPTPRGDGEPLREARVGPLGEQKRA